MERQGEEVRETAEEARAGSTPGIVRWVLLISLLLATSTSRLPTRERTHTR